MRNVRYDYSSCHVDVPSPYAEEIVAWGREAIPDDDLFVTQRAPTFGREDEVHITILYGIHGESADPVRKLMEGFGPVRVDLGSVAVFSNPLKFDVVVIEAFSDDLCRLNDLLQRNVKFTNKYTYYNPHVTVAYVQKGKGWKYYETRNWSGHSFHCETAVFSSKNGSKELILL